MLVYYDKKRSHQERDPNIPERSLNSDTICFRFVLTCIGSGKLWSSIVIAGFKHSDQDIST